MQIDVITLFPEMFSKVFDEGVIKRAMDKKIVEIKYHQMRQWAWNSYGAVDDKPYGGDIGMIIRADVIGTGLEEIGAKRKTKGQKIIVLSARGKRLTQRKVEELAKLKRIVMICGRYEGIDQRVADNLADEEISIGDFVLSGGEIAAMTIIDAVARLQKGVLGKDDSSKIESFSNIGGKRVKESPQYTRPFEYMGWKVPEELLSGDPKKIRKWKSKF